MGARAGAVISELYNIQNWKCIQLHAGKKKNALLHTMSSMLVEVKFMEELIMADKVLFGPLEEVRSKLWRH
jgi:hypothetical protein